MARKPRIEYEGAVYHLMSRGDHGEDIFRDDEDRSRFFKCLEATCRRTGWRMHAYVLMNNHYHLLTETPEGNLVVGMKWLQGTYTQRFNARHHLRGHLFQGRYKALLLDSEERGYFLKVSSYIHLNAVRAGTVDLERTKLEEYRWSSYPLYLKRVEQRPAWLCVERVLGDLGVENDRGGRRLYGEYLNREARAWLSGKGRCAQNIEWKAVRQGWYLGSERFRERAMEKLAELMKGKKRYSYNGEELESHGERMAGQILKKGKAIFGVTDKVLNQLNKSDSRKQILAWLLRRQTTVRNCWVSRELRMGHEINVTRAVHAVEEGRDPELNQLRTRLEKRLKVKGNFII